MDAFVCALLRSSKQESVLFSETIVQQGALGAGASRRVAKRFVQSCVRVFVTLCSVRTKGFKAKQQIMMAMFECGPLLAIPVLAEMADDVSDHGLCRKCGLSFILLAVIASDCGQIR